MLKILENSKISKLVRDPNLDKAAKDVIDFNLAAKEPRLLLRSKNHPDLRGTVKAYLPNKELPFIVGGNLGVHADNGHDFLL